MFLAQVNPPLPCGRTALWVCWLFPPPQAFRLSGLVVLFLPLNPTAAPSLGRGGPPAVGRGILSYRYLVLENGEQFEGMRILLRRVLNLCIGLSLRVIQSVFALCICWYGVSNSKVQQRGASSKQPMYSRATGGTPPLLEFQNPAMNCGCACARGGGTWTGPCRERERELLF